MTAPKRSLRPEHFFYSVQNKLLNLQRKKAAYGGKLKFGFIICIFALLAQNNQLKLF